MDNIANLFKILYCNISSSKKIVEHLDTKKYFAIVARNFFPYVTKILGTVSDAIRDILLTLFGTCHET